MLQRKLAATTTQPQPPSGGGGGPSWLSVFWDSFNWREAFNMVLKKAREKC
jgi:hypothetical protein